MFDQVATEILVQCDSPAQRMGALGVFEMVCGVLLIVPAAVNWMQALTPLAAAALALETLALAGLYGQYSLQLTAANPLVWAGLMALLAAVVASGCTRSCRRRTTDRAVR